MSDVKEANDLKSLKKFILEKPVEVRIIFKDDGCDTAILVRDGKNIFFDRDGRLGSNLRASDFARRGGAITKIVVGL